MALSDQIRTYRIERGLTQSELARRAHISKGYLSHFENRQNRSHPTGEVLYRIAFALGVSVGVLLEKQIKPGALELPEIPAELREFALAQQLPDEVIIMLARIEIRGHRPRTVKDWSYLYESIRRSVWLMDDEEIGKR
jgi:transcriptional regulator with XRE-family HTH domain